MGRENVILEKSIDFSVSLIRFCDRLQMQKKFIIAGQLLRCGTSIGANVFEAQHTESRADFIHKMKLAIKEANESLYWLILCERSETYPDESNLRTEVEEMIKIISKIIASSQNKLVKS